MGGGRRKGPISYIKIDKSIRLIFSYLVKNIKYRIPPLVPSFPCLSPNGRMSRSKALEEPWIFFKKDDDAVAPLAGKKKVHLPRSAVSIVLATSLRTFTCKTVDSIGGVICRRSFYKDLYFPLSFVETGRAGETGRLPNQHHTQIGCGTKADASPLAVNK